MTAGRRSALPLAGAFAALALGLAAGPAAAQEPSTAFAADSTQLGVISLLFWGAQGGEVRYYERVGDKLESLGSARSAAGSTSSPCSVHPRRSQTSASRRQPYDLMSIRSSSTAEHPRTNE